MKKALIVIALLHIVSCAFGQSWKWVRSVSSPGGGSEGWITKTDVYNNAYIVALWQGDSISFGTNTFYNHAPDYQTAIAKYDSSGNLKWGLASSHGQCMPLSFTTDNIGNTYLYGLFWTDSIMFGTHLLINDHLDSALYIGPGEGCYFIIKFDTSGNILWTKTGDNSAATFGSGAGIAIDNAANVYIVGTFLNSTINIGPFTLANSNHDTGDVFVAKYDSSGNVIWAKSFGGPVREYGVDIAISKTDKVYITGVFSSDSVSFDGIKVFHSGSFGSLYYAYCVFLVEMDTTGAVLWAKTPSGCAVVNGIAVDSANNILIGGYLADTSFVAFGSDTLRDANLNYGAFFAKYDNLSNPMWARGIYPISSLSMGYSGYTNNVLYGITTDPCNNVWISCRLNNEDTAAGIRIDSTTVIHVPYGSRDPMLFAEYNSAGSLQQYFCYKSGGDDYSSVATDHNGNIYLCGDTWQNLIFGIDSVVPHGGETMFLSKYHAIDCHIGPLLQNNSNLRSDFAISPNPTSGNFTVTCPQYQGTSIAICDLAGRLLYSQRLTATATTISTAELSPGMYICRITADGQVVDNKKLVVVR